MRSFISIILMLFSVLVLGCKGKGADSSPPSPIDRRTNQDTTHPEPPILNIPVRNGLGTTTVTQLLTTASILKCSGASTAFDNKALVFSELSEFDKNLSPLTGLSNLDEYLQKALGFFKTHAPLETREIEASLKQLKQAPNQSLGQFPDEGMKWIPNGCTLVPVVGMYLSGDQPAFVIDSTQLKAVDSASQAAVYLQMALSKQAYLRKAQDYLGARRVTRLLLSTWQASLAGVINLLQFLHPMDVVEVAMLNGDVLWVPVDSSFVRNLSPFSSLEDEQSYQVCGYQLASGESNAKSCPGDEDRFRVSTQSNLRVTQIYPNGSNQPIWSLKPSELGLPDYVTDFKFYSNYRGILLHTNKPIEVQYPQYSITCGDNGRGIIYYPTETWDRATTIDLSKATGPECANDKSGVGLLKFRIGQNQFVQVPATNRDYRFELDTSKNPFSVSFGKLNVNIPNKTYVTIYKTDIQFDFYNSVSPTFQAVGTNCTIAVSSASTNGQTQSSLPKGCEFSGANWSYRLDAHTMASIDLNTLELKAWQYYQNPSVRLAGQTVSPQSMSIGAGGIPVALAIANRTKNITYYRRTTKAGKVVQIKKVISGLDDFWSSDAALCYEPKENRLYLLMAIDPAYPDPPYFNSNDQTCRQFVEAQ